MTLDQMIPEEPAFPTGLDVDVWLAPRTVEVHDGVVRFAYTVRVARGRRRNSTHAGRPIPTLLTSFVRLARTADASAAVSRFAQRHGVLHLCGTHGLPASHALRSRARQSPDEDGLDVDAHDVERLDCAAESHRSEGTEPVARWLDYSREAGAIVAIADALHRDRLGPDEPWRVLADQLAAWHPLSFLLAEKPPDSLVIARSFITWLVDRWVADSGIRPQIVWRQGIDVRFGGGGLFGALAAQLVFAVAKTAPLATCSHCGQVYAPSRKPRTGERHFCIDCREEGIPARLARRDLRARRAMSGQ